MLRPLGLALICGIGFAALPAQAQTSGCAAIQDRNARLDCYDRAPRAASPPPRYSAPAQQGCTRASPCIGPRGGVYYITPSGNKRYLPR
ncbi:hypothetical protein IAI18_10855 [Acetobacteraceae bacterium H6797]|nr:hypothetical protein [Acetobacteraceae bacterium H6797]